MFTKEEKKKKEKEEGRGNNKDALTPVALIIASLLFPSSFSRRLSRGRYPERKPYPGESNPSFPFSVYQVTRARFETTDPIRVTHAHPSLPSASLPTPCFSFHAYASIVCRAAEAEVVGGRIEAEIATLSKVGPLPPSRLSRRHRAAEQRDDIL